MVVELLYFDDCPSWERVLEELTAIQNEKTVQFSVHLRNIKSDEEATRLKFLGSPSIQIDGIDLWPEVRSTYAMNCRMYRTPEGLKGWPSLDMIRQRLHERRTTSSQ